MHQWYSVQKCCCREPAGLNLLLNYDMNDLVLIIKERKISINKSNKAEEFTLSLDLSAAGATMFDYKQLQFFRVDTNRAESKGIILNIPLITGISNEELPPVFIRSSFSPSTFI